MTSKKISPFTKDFALVAIVTMMTIGANLPEGAVAMVGIDQIPTCCSGWLRLWRFPWCAT